MAKTAHLTGEDTPIIGDDCVIRTTLDEVGSISGWTFGFLLKVNRNQADAAAVVAEDTSGVTQVINDAGGVASYGVIDTTIPASVMATLTHGVDYWYAIQRVDSGLKTTLVHGDFPARLP